LIDNDVLLTFKSTQPNHLTQNRKSFMSLKLYHVRAHNVGQTLAQMLRNIYHDKTWAQVKQMVLSRRVQVNGNLCVDETRRLKADEIVKISAESMDKPPDAQRINVRYQDEHIMVVEKPPGITTQRHREEQHWDDKRKNRQPTLEELLQQIVHTHGVSRLPGRGAGSVLQKQRNQLNQKINRGKMQLKVRAVHRLDRDTSGLMIFALSTTAEQALVKRFAGHEIERAYLAVVHGVIDAPGTVTSHLVRDRGDGLRGSLAPGRADNDAKIATTHYKPVRSIDGKYTLIECRLETGRTHQIRIHLSERNHVLCGDDLYTRPRVGDEPVIDTSNAPRQALHACKLAFDHPITDQRMTFEQALPTDLRKWLKKLDPREALIGAGKSE
jgi:23S rRNA pseudouridine1911/1915/1917 synthase